MPVDGRDDEAAPEPATAGSDDAPVRPALWAIPEESASGAALWAGRVVKAWSRELHPLLGQIGHEKATDMPSGADLADADADLATPLYRPIRIEVATTVDLDEVLAFDVSATLVRLYDMADEWGGQLVRGMLEHISDVSIEHGRAVDARGRGFIDLDSSRSLGCW